MELNHKLPIPLGGQVGRKAQHSTVIPDSLGRDITLPHLVHTPLPACPCPLRGDAQNIHTNLKRGYRIPYLKDKREMKGLLWSRTQWSVHESEGKRWAEKLCDTHWGYEVDTQPPLHTHTHIPNNLVIIISYRNETFLWFFWPSPPTSHWPRETSFPSITSIF